MLVTLNETAVTVDKITVGVRVRIPEGDYGIGEIDIALGDAVENTVGNLGLCCVLQPEPHATQRLIFQLGYRRPAFEVVGNEFIHRRSIDARCGKYNSDFIGLSRRHYVWVSLYAEDEILTHVSTHDAEFGDACASME